MKQRPQMKEYPDGTRAWSVNDQLHRKDGPAVERPDGYRSWWVNGKRHREDGPAIEDPDGTREWWIRGQQLIEEEFNNHRFRIWAVEGRLIGTTEETTK